VFLWLLEPDRKENRERFLQETYRNSVVQPPNTPHSQWFISDKAENKRPVFVETEDFEELLKEKAGLEEKLNCLDEEQTKLDLRARMLCEKIIQELKKRNSEKQQAANQLRIEIGRMETLLGLKESVQETKEKNGEKQEEISRLREIIGALETQFEELVGSDAPVVGKAEKVDDRQDIPPSEAFQGTNVGIKEEIK
jgi:DNA repair exonuclease SbcCD ATPase subunit